MHILPRLSSPTRKNAHKIRVPLVSPRALPTPLCRAITAPKERAERAKLLLFVMLHFLLALASPRPTTKPIDTSDRHIRSMRWSHGKGSALSASDVQVLTGLLPTSSAFSETARMMRTVSGLDARGTARGLIPNATSLVGGCRSELPRRQPGSSPYGKLLNLCDAVGPGVEVGVFQGSFSKVMLGSTKFGQGSWRGLTHYTLVDLWARQNESVYVKDSANVRSASNHSPRPRPRPRPRPNPNPSPNPHPNPIPQP